MGQKSYDSQTAIRVVRFGVASILPFGTEDSQTAIFSSEVSSGQYLAICQRKKSHDTTIRVSEVLSGQYRSHLGEKRKKCVCHCRAVRGYCLPSRG